MLTVGNDNHKSKDKQNLTDFNSKQLEVLKEEVVKKDKQVQQLLKQILEYENQLRRDNSKIINNYFYRNSSGIYIEGSNRIIVYKNEFMENGWAIRLMANSMDNTFTQNNFIGNSFDIATNSTQSYNEFNNNFWSEYQGYDIDKNGIGDIPYRPVKLFSLIVEKNRPTLILLRSLFVDILDAAERIFPVLTPETLIDNSPSMKRIL